jgi:hypothetical protein
MKGGGLRRKMKGEGMRRSATVLFSRCCFATSRTCHLLT